MYVHISLGCSNISDITEDRAGSMLKRKGWSSNAMLCLDQAGLVFLFGATACQWYVPIAHAHVIKLFAVASQQDEQAAASQQAKQAATSQQEQQARSSSMRVHIQRQYLCGIAACISAPICTYSSFVQVKQLWILLIAPEQAPYRYHR